jgi:hypothetical protein
MYLPVNKETFVNYISKRFPDRFTKKGLGILFDYLKQHEERTGIEEALDPQQILLSYEESNYYRFAPKHQIEESIGEGKKLCSSIGASGRSFKELQQNVKKHIERSSAICIGFTSDKTVVYTRN